MTKSKAVFRYSFSILFLILGFVLGSCDVFAPGLGEAIDIEAPVVGIESHSNGDYVGGTISLFGYASDDEGVTSVIMTIGSQTFNASCSQETWSLDLDTTPYSDGEYEITVSANDGSGKKDSVSLLLIVDNKPPTVIVTTPSLYSGKVFNGQIEVKGEAADKTRVKEVWVYLYQEGSDTLVYSGKATGTTSWFTSVDSTAFATSNYYVNVIATDFTGNKNTWFYHISDIYDISNDIANIPNIEEIDGADNQNVPITVGPSGTLSAALDTIRLTKSGLQQMLFNIDQDSDIPVIQFDDIVVGGTSADNAVYPDGTIRGSAEDDDLIVATSLEIQIDLFNDSVFSGLDLNSDGYIGDNPGDNPDVNYDNELEVWIPVSDQPDSDSKNVDWGHSFAWIPQGEHSFRMRVSDNTGAFYETPWTTFVIDQGPPSLIISSPPTGSIFTSSFSITGQASDNNDVVSVDISFDGGSTRTDIPVTIGISVNWTYNFTVDPAGSTDGDYTYLIRATDGSGRTTEIDRRVIVDATAPTVEIDLPQEGSTVNGTAVEIRGTSNDNRTIGSVYISIDSEGNDPPADLSGWLDSGDGLVGKYSWTYSLDSTTLTNGNYIISATSVDSAGNQSAIVSRQITVDQESDRPDISFNDIDKSQTVAANNVLSGANYLVGSITDDDLIDPSLFGGNAIEISLDGGAWEPVSNPPLSIKSTVQWSHDISSLTEGTHTVKVRARDNLSDGTVGASSISAQYTSNFNWGIEDSVDQGGIPFILNSGPPELIIDDLDYYQNDDFTISGDAYDGSGLLFGDHDGNAGTPDTEYIEIYDGSAWSNVPVTSGSWSFPVDVSVVGDGSITYQFRATDRFGKVSVDSLDIVIDTAGPVITVNTPVDGEWTNVQSLSMTGTAADDNGIVSVQVSTDNVNWINLTGTVSWNGLLNISSFQQIDKELYFRCVDVAGNEAVETIYINIDRVAPVLTETGINTANTTYVKTGYTLSGTLTDNLTGSLPTYDNGSADVEYVDLTINAAAPVKIDVDGSGNWSYSPVFSGSAVSYTLGISDRAGNSSPVISRTIVEDNSAPSIPVITTPTGAGYISGSAYSISGTASDSGISGLATLYWWAGDNGVDPPADYSNWNTAIGTDNWSGSLNLTTLGEGSKTLHVVAVDRCQNYSTGSTRDFSVDQAPPTLTETVSGISGSAVVYRNADIDLGGVVSDGTGITSLVVSYSKNGGAVQTLLTDTVDDGIWNTTLPVSTGDGSYELSIEGTDSAGRTTTIYRNIVIDTNPPELTVETPVEDELVDSSSYTLSGKISDNGGKGVSALQYSRDNSIWTDITVTGFSWNLAGVDFSSPVGSENTQGGRTLYIRATDGLNPEVLKTIHFYYDTEDPVLTETEFDGATEQYSTASVGFSGLASDTNALASLQLIINGGAPVDLTVDGGDNSWSYTQPNTTDGTFSLVFKATDAAGRVTTVTRNTVIDATNPSAPAISSSPGNYVTSSLNITGTAGDATSGIASVQYSIDGESNWTALSGTDNWYGSINVSAEPVGSKTVYIRSIDRAGNISASVSQNYIIDRDDPSLTVTGFTGTEYRNASFTISGTMDDRDLGASPVSISVTLDGTPVDLIGYPLVQNTVSKTWSQDIPVSNGDNGTCRIIITATDAVGRSTSSTRDVGIDTSAPTLTVTTDLSGWFGSNTVLIEGTASDSGSQLKEIQYSFDETTWHNLAVTTTWSRYISIPSGPTNPLYLRSMDNVGNESSHAGYNVKVDTTSPVTTMVSPLSLAKLNGTADLAIQILAQDIGQSGVVSAKVKINSTDFSSPDASRILLPADAEFDDTWSLTLPAAAVPVTEGQVDINVQFTDVAGNTKIQSFSVLVDRTPPSVPEISSHNDDDIINRTVRISGSATDTQGLAQVTLEIYNTGGSWEPLSTVGTYSWYADLDTESYDSAAYDNDGVTAGTQISLRCTASDTAGNTATAARDLVIDQNSDRPVITINNLETTGLDTLKLSRTVYGSLVDDDGITSFAISEDDTNWTSITLSGSSWQYDVSAANGTKYLYFRAVDTKGRTFTTNGTYEPRIIGKSSGEIADVLVFRLDTITPEIYSSITADRLAPFDFVADTQTLTTNMPFGGTSSHFALKVLARDANTIDTVVINIPGLGDVATTKGADESGYETYTTAELDVSALLDGSVDVVITVTDDSGLTSTATRTILLDNTAPDITYLSPRSSLDVVNGDIPVKGLSSDSGSALASVEYKLGYNYADETWQPVSGSLFNWEIDLSGVNKIDHFAGIEVENVNTNGTISLTAHGYNDDTAVWVGASTLPTGLSATATYYIVNATADTFELAAAPGGTALTFASVGSEVRISKYSRDYNGDSIWELPVIVRATDYAGNSSVVSDSEYIVLVDPSGDKPHAFIVYPDPDNTNRVMGGIIRIFGTAEDDDGVGSVYMQIDVNGDGVFDGSDVDSLFVDWYNGGEGIAVTGTASWNMNINTSGEFNPVSGTRPINFRVRVKDIYGTYGPWTDSQHIDVDNSVPKIGSSEAPTLTQGATVQNYVSDIYIRGNWVLEGTIEDESDISDIQISGDISGSLTANSSWFTSYSSGSGTYGYRMQIPVNTSGTGRYVFTVTAIDNSDPKTNNSATFRINYDNTAPTLDAYAGQLPVEQSNKTYHLTSTVNEGGSGLERVAFYFLRQGATDPEDRIYNPMETKTADVNRTYLNHVYGDGSTLSFIDDLPRLNLSGATRTDEYSLQHNDIIGNTNIRKGGLIKIGGLDRLITSVNYATGEISWSGSVDQSVTTAAVAYALIVDHELPETPVWNPDNTLASITNDDGDGLIEELSNTGTEYTWDAYIDSKEIPDGPIEIHWVAFDKSGNYTSDFVSTEVLNHRPLLASVLLGTDLDGDGAVSESEKVPAYSALDGLGNEQAIATIASGDFIAKGNTTIDLEVLGGNGALDYVMYQDSVAGGNEVSGHDLNNGGSNVYLRDTELSAVNTISLTSAQITSSSIADTIITGGPDSNNTKDFIIKIWDSTEETTLGTDSQYAILTMPIQIDVTDQINPKAVISPFFWNGTGDGNNSLYGGLKVNGHIELESDLPAGVFNQASGVFDLDPKVSGQISLRGSAYDDKRISSLWMFIGDNATSEFSFPNAIETSDQFDTDGDGSLETLSRTYTKVAEYDTVNHLWVPVSSTMAANGWAFSVSQDYLDQSGNRVSWQLDWDSSRIIGVAAADRQIRIIAVDSRPNASDETVNPAADVASNNVPSYQMDVVPYVVKISTPKLTNSGLKDNNIRSSDGKYSIISGTDNTFATVSGFNLNPSAVRIIDSATVATNGVTNTSGNALVYGNIASDFTSFSMSNNSLHSGYIEVFTSNIRALNNVNSNDAAGFYTGLNVSELYNREPDLILLKNPTLTDDRYIRFFDMKNTGIKNAYYPDMLMNGDNPVFGYVDLNGINSTVSPLTTYQNQCYQPQRAEFNSSTGVASDISYLIGGLTWDQMAMARDTAGIFYNASVYNYNGARMSVIYDQYAENHTWSGYTDGWGAGVSYSGYGGVFANQENNNAIALESINEGAGALIGRYQNLKLMAKGDSTTVSGASVYMAYYDDNTANKNIIFRTFKVGQNASWGNTLSDGYSNLNEQDTAGRTAIATGGSKFLDMTVTSSNIVAVIYYDMSIGKLKLVYSSGAIDGSDTTPNQTWITSTVDFPEYIGPDVSMTVDSNDGLHISAYDTGNSDLYYMYLPAYNSTSLTKFRVDQAFAVGNWTKIKVQESGGNIVPFIAYYNSTETGSRDSIKLAYSMYPVGDADFAENIDINDNVVGTWEFMNVPAITPPQGGDSRFKQVNLGFDTVGTPVLGYLGTNLEFGKWIAE